MNILILISITWCIYIALAAVVGFVLAVIETSDLLKSMLLCMLIAWICSILMAVAASAVASPLYAIQHGLPF